MLSIAARYPQKIMQYFARVLFHPDWVAILHDEPDDDELLLSVEQLRTLHTNAGRLFGTVLADDAHKLKSVNTRTHQSIARLGAQRMLLITATPTINKSIDLFGTLSLI